MRALLLVAITAAVASLLSFAADEPKREPGKVYTIKGFGPIKNGAKTALLEGRFAIKEYPKEAKPEDQHCLILDDVCIAAGLIHPALGAEGAGQPKEGKVGVAVYIFLGSAIADKKREYTRWEGLKIVDDKKNEYDQIAFPDVPKIASLTGKKTRIDSSAACDVLFFEPPVRDVKNMTLDLPGENIGSKGVIKLSFDADALRAAYKLDK